MSQKTSKSCMRVDPTTSFVHENPRPETKPPGPRNDGIASMSKTITLKLSREECLELLNGIQRAKRRQRNFIKKMFCEIARQEL